MKQMQLIILILIIISFCQAQDISVAKDFDYTAYGQMIYWKALSLEEKKVFLHAYLYRTHEIGKEIKEDRKLKSVSSRYDDAIAGPVYKIFRDLDDAGKTKLIYWIDTFYQHEFNQDAIFKKALEYAFRKIETGNESMNDIYKRSFPE